LAREAADPQHRQPHTVNQHQTHLQQNFQPVGNDGGFAIGKTLGTITSLQQEAPPFLRVSDLLLERQNLP
jgi:hypothetical protein